MALEYSIYIEEKDALDHKKIESILSELNWNPKIEMINEKITMFLVNNDVGFLLYSRFNANRIIDLNDKEKKFNIILTLRINKDCDDPILYKKNILIFLLKIRYLIISPLLLLFNGEIVILKSNKNNIIIGKSGFWNQELKQELIGIYYEEQKFEIL